MEEASKYGVLGRHQSCSEERIEVQSNTIERYHSSRKTSSLLYSESCSEWKLKKSYTRKYMRHLVLKHEWMKELGSEVVQRPDGQVVWQSKSSQSNRLPWRKSRARSRAINAERGEHWLQNTWIATFCCETSSELSCSWIGQEDREPPSPTFSSTKSTTKPSLQSVQSRTKEHDSGRGQRGAVWTVRDRPWDAVQRMPIYHTGVKAFSIAHAGISWKKLCPTEASLNTHWTFFQFQNT